ncbi:MAG: peptidoglycan DD-metalloendopeptidase family protein [Candidatus Sumerlaeia bacterium]
MILACAAGCGRSSKKQAQKTPVIQTKTIVLDYRNGWYHEADGIQSIESVSRQYRRDPQFVAQLNYTTPSTIPTRGKLLYIPPSNDRAYVRAALQRVQGRPELVPTVPWSEDLVKQPGKPQSQPRPEIRVVESSKKKKKRVRNDDVIEVADASGVVNAPASHTSQSLISWPNRRAKNAPRDDGRFMWPAQGEVVTRFREGWNKACHGLEIRASEGSPVVAARSGRVLVAQEYPGYGKMVLIDHGDGFASVYGYNSSLLVRERQLVQAGQKIATIGRPSYGDSGKLFFQIRRNAQPIDPLEFLQ